MYSKNQRLNVIIFPGFYLPHIGGVEAYVNEFVKNSSYLADVQYTIFAPQIPANGKEYEIDKYGTEIYRYPAFEIIPNYPVPKIWNLKFWNLFFKIYGREFDYTMTHTMFFINTFLGFVNAKCKIHSHKLIHIEHGSDFSKLNSSWKSAINKFYIYAVGKLVLKNADEIIAISDSVKLFLHSKFIPHRKIHTIYRGYDFALIDRVTPDIEFKEGYDDKKIILYAGRLVEAKGVHDLIEAFSQIPNEDCILILLGDGDYRQNLEDLVIQKNLSDKVKFHGFVPYEEVLSKMKVSDVFINPSYTEGLPTAVLDAYFSECRIIATDVGGTKEIIDEWDGKNYILIPHKNVQILKQALETILNTSKKECNIDRENFRWEKTIMCYLKLLKLK